MAVPLVLPVLMLQNLALLYLAIAHGTDQSLTDDELEVMVRRLRDWAPELSEDDVKMVILEASAVYLHGDRDAEIEQAMLSIRAEADVIDRLLALDGLIEVADADGVRLASEDGLIEALRDIWQLNPQG